MALSSWLFIRIQEASGSSGPTSFLSSSPAQDRRTRTYLFPNDDALQAHQIATAERLTQAGWFLWGFDRERRNRDDRLAASIDLNRQSRRDRRDSGLVRDGMTFGSGRK